MIRLRRFQSICPTAASTLRPRPRASTTEAVSPDGPPSAPSAQRSAGRPRVSRPRPARRASARSAAGGEEEKRERAGDAACGPERELRRAGEERRRSDEDEREAGGRRQVGQPRPRPAGGGQVAEERRGADVPRPRERPEREQERCQEPVERGLGERGRMKAGGDRHRQAVGEQRNRDRGKRGTGGEAERDAEDREQRDLGEVDREHRAAGGAERLEGGDRGGARLHVGADGGRDADAADGEAGEPDEDQEGAETIDEAAEAGSAVAAVPPLQPRVAEARLGLGLERRQVAARGQAQAVGGVEERSLGQEAALREVGEPHDHPRAETEAAAGRVGLGDERVGEPEVPRPEADHGAGEKAEAVDQRALGDETRKPVARGERVVETPAACERDRAVERIPAIDRLDLDKGRITPGRRRHRAEVDDLGHRGGVWRPSRRARRDRRSGR